LKQNRPQLPFPLQKRDDWHSSHFRVSPDHWTSTPKACHPLVKASVDTGWFWTQSLAWFLVFALKSCATFNNIHSLGSFLDRINKLIFFHNCRPLEDSLLMYSRKKYQTKYWASPAPQWAEGGAEDTRLRLGMPVTSGHQVILSSAQPPVAEQISK
jgi:hypothetical protein